MDFSKNKEVLRQVFGSVEDDKVWKIKRNIKIKSLCDKYNLTSLIKNVKICRKALLGYDRPLPKGCDSYEDVETTEAICF